ncbi:MAG: hypothetical protein MJ240_09160 [Kiritimatiellae bacterium]|nr:hypothetical protein [Kiritimatiellia bacterium]
MQIVSLNRVGGIFTLIFALVVVPAFSAGELLESFNTLSVLKVLSPSTNTIVAVPWAAFSTNANAAIEVSRLVCPDGLSDGDVLHVPSADGAQAWRLESRRWVPVLTASSKGVTQSGSADSVVLPRGAAFWLVRRRPRDAQGAPIPFYLCGQRASVSVRPQFSRGSTSAPVFHLLANPSARATDINALDWEGVGANDTIVIPSGSAGGAETVLIRRDGGWGFWDARAVWDPTRRKYKIQQTYVTEVQVPAGTGFWYVSRGGLPALEWR